MRPAPFELLSYIRSDRRAADRFGGRTAAPPRAPGCVTGWIAAVLLLCVLSGSLEARTATLLSDRSICDQRGVLCVRGTLRYDEADNRFSYRGRVERPTQPVRAYFLLEGETPAGQGVTFQLGLRVDGRYSELVHVEVKPDAPTGTRWRLRGLYLSS